MGTEFVPKHEYEVRTRKAHFWIGLRQKASIAWGIIFSLLIMTIIGMALLSVSGKGVSTGLFGNFMFALLILFIISGAVIIACNFIINLYNPGQTTCSGCQYAPSKCLECGYQNLTRLESEKNKKT